MKLYYKNVKYYHVHKHVKVNYIAFLLVNYFQGADKYLKRHFDTLGNNESDVEENEHLTPKGMYNLM